MFTSTSFIQDVVVRNYTLPSSLCLSQLGRMFGSGGGVHLQAGRDYMGVYGAARILEINDWECFCDFSVTDGSLAVVFFN